VGTETAQIVSPPPLEDSGESTSIGCGAPLDHELFAGIRKRMALECCKWDPQVEDVSVLQAFPLLLRRRQWRLLAGWAEALAAETRAAEDALLERPDLVARLAVPRRLVRPILRGLHLPSPEIERARVMRFDFHPTEAGWRISEVNSDVPGGFSEASEFPSLMARHYPGYAPAGLPGPVFADALARLVARSGATHRRAALVSAAGFMEDLQTVSYLGRLLAARGVEPQLVDPAHLRFDGALAVRFHQAEWLSGRRHAAVARYLLGGGPTPVVNPGRAMLSESKRFPLVWDELRLGMPSWRRLLPETRDPRAVSWRRDSGWLLKTAFCNTGDTVSSRLTMPPRQWSRAAASATLFPRAWVAQRRFHGRVIDTPSGAMYPCIGVYTVGGRACGIYGRLSRNPVVTYSAADVAVLVEE
jgi:hypothetical protein